jgi:hypothetical protein
MPRHFENVCIAKFCNILLGLFLVLVTNVKEFTTLNIFSENFLKGKLGEPMENADSFFLELLYQSPEQVLFMALSDYSKRSILPPSSTF